MMRRPIMLAVLLALLSGCASLPRVTPRAGGILGRLKAPAPDQGAKWVGRDSYMKSLGTGKP